MKTEMFTDLIDAVREALEHAKGQRALRSTTRPLALRKGRPVKRRKPRSHTA